MMTRTWRERPQSIEIPVRESNEVVEVFLDELPNDPSEIRAILYAEGAPIELFLHFAVLKSRNDHLLEILCRLSITIKGNLKNFAI